MTRTDARLADIHRLECARIDATPSPAIHAHAYAAWDLLHALVAVGGIPDETWKTAVAYVEPQTELERAEVA